VPRPRRERAIEQLVRAGNKLIFTTSFGYMDPTLKVAKKYPKRALRALLGLQARQEHVDLFGARYRAVHPGQIAAKMSNSGVLGYIGSFTIRKSVSGINATMLGAQSVNPNMKVKIIWVNSWFDRARKLTRPRHCSTRAPT